MTGDTVETVTDTLRVRKYFDVESTAHPLIRFFISLYTTVPVRLTLLDPLPEEITADDIAFHPKYHGECWSVSADHVQFECSLAWGATVETAYAVACSEDELSSFLLAPTVRLIDPTGAELETVPQESFRSTGEDVDTVPASRPSGLTAAFDTPEPPVMDGSIDPAPTGSEPPTVTSPPETESEPTSEESANPPDRNGGFIFDRS
ncbi:MAG: hypothetical protein ABEH65_00145 [Halobacteriales archaeon]